MFSLIISIIAIALVAALALASIYYGGSAFNEGTAKADASTLINQGQQIQAAVTMQNVDRNTLVSTISGLATNGEYLQEAPEFMGEAWADPVSGYSVHGATLVAGVCKEINRQAGFDVESTNTPLDTSDDAPAAANEGLFGCFGSKAYYKVGSFYTNA